MRVGTVCFATRQGIGILARDFYREGIVTDVVMIQHPKYENHPEWYPPETPFVNHRAITVNPRFQEMVENLDAMLFFETPFDFQIYDYCKSKGVRTYCVPMYEWSLRNPPYKPDKYICPSLLDVQYFPGSQFVPIPVPRQIKWSLREKAHRFLHNAGHLGHRGHKGTLEILKAMQYVRSPIEITFTSQDVPGMEQKIAESGLKFGANVKFDYSDKPWEELYNGYDVFIMAEKFNGCSLPLQEARANGLLIMTSNRFPMNAWLPTEPLINVSSYHKACISNSYNEFDEAEIDPKDIASKIDEMYDRDIRDYSLSGLEWARMMGWDNLKSKWLEILGK